MKIGQNQEKYIRSEQQIATKKYVKLLEIHFWVSPHAGHVRAGFDIRAPHSKQYFVGEPLDMPTDSFVAGIIFKPIVHI